jgi:DNA polymerase III subunit alpha
MGIEVLVPDVNLSVSEFAARDKAITFGLSAVRNVGTGLVERIVAERDERGPFTDFDDFCERVDPVVLNKRTVESLVKAGAFDSLGHPRKGLCLVFEQIVDRTLERRRKEAEGQFSLFGGDASEEPAGGFDLVPIPDTEFDKHNKLAFEKEMLGLYISDHPLMGVESRLRRHVDCTIDELRERGDTEVRLVGGVVTSLVRKYTKKGELMATFVLEDLQSAIEAWVFPRTMQEYGHLLVDDAVVSIKGRLDTRDDTPKIVCMEVRRPELGSEGAEPMKVVLPLARLDDETVEKLKRVLVEHPGDSPVLLGVGDKLLRLPDEFNVDSSNGLCAELRVLLGADCL